MKKIYLIFLFTFSLFSCENNNDDIQENCSITNLNVLVGDCTTENTYNLLLDFDYENAANESFDVYVRNNEFIGNYNLDELPLSLENFEMSGLENDYIKVCINDNSDCCDVIEFAPPQCNEEGECEISNLSVDIGECTSENTYTLTLDFDYQNQTNDSFDVYTRNNQLIGYYNLSELPLTLENFEMSGLENDYIKVCINDNSDCCDVIEFAPPQCNEGECEISNLSVDIGECTSENTYTLTLDFDYQNQTNDSFDVYTRNNQLIGYYNLSDLPLTLENFEMSGLENDYIKVCINDNSDCCDVIEFAPPQCNEGECEISNLTVDVGECTSENTYTLTLTFDYQNPGNNYFDLYKRNGVYMGYYSLSDLPLTLENFEMSGLEYDYLKVCINDNENCCKATEFLPPVCD